MTRSSFRQAIGSLALLLLLLAVVVSAEAVKHEEQHASSGPSMSLDELEAKLQTCAVVQDLNAQKLAASADSSSSSFVSRAFAVLFPGSPAVNAILATLYISGPPNFLLALCPPNIDPSSLGIMVAFAVGGLLGDTLFHLLPEIFLGEDSHDSVKLVLVEPNRNLLLGVAIMVGFMTFVAMDKGLRIATGGAGGHDHGHSHGHAHNDDSASATASGVESSDAAGVKSRKKADAAKSGVETTEVVNAAGEKEMNPSVKLGGYLNLIADFTHNITDGLAMSASFYASPTIGATTTVAVFFHEIPHEVGDFALLVQSGFSKRAAMGAQFVTALGALLGTLIGIAVQELGGNSKTAAAGAAPMGMTEGLWGTSLTWGDMLLPFTAGTFLYVGTVSVIPELLETGPNKALELRKMVQQFAAVAVGAGIMLYISWD
ncbi:ZIP zinc transporter-domain-containing protein [Microdochium trichocladiopsis]|uniref:ZIP zinc transporter-domain-containing protein n=1 Tax=Microdochium trichocladiopsis TaxID=1682393 RepID=A0A9P9BTP8_9PEZI|nr:ZIP zinc transporter-domain-containing protein [Microdochium trichocladiopsis]KAH7035702.1 ZIP zinc transporter-domain-containing protein [Microdochium trichocladiopsis]